MIYIKSELLKGWILLLILREDKLLQWHVGFSKGDGEIYYYNTETKSVTYDYPLPGSLPYDSPKVIYNTETIFTRMINKISTMLVY